MTSDQAKGPRGHGAAGTQGRRRRKEAATTARRRAAECRWSRVLMPWVEGLEDRRLLATITWNTTTAPTGGDWNVAANWNGGTVPGPGDTATISKLTSPGTVYLNSNISDSVFSLGTDSSVNLEVISGSLSLGAASSSTFGGPATVYPGATLGVSAGSSLTIGDGQTLTVQGTTTVKDATVVINRAASYGSGSDGILVTSGGTLTTDGASFVRSAIGYDNHENARIEVGTGGHLTATDTTFSIDNLYLDGGLVLNQGDLSNNIFNVPIYAPVADAPLLTANQSFGAVYLQGALNPNQSLTLAPMGTQTTAGQYYVLPNGLTVAAGQSLTIDGEASVTIGDNQTLTVQGTTTVKDATVVINRAASYGSGSDGILVTSGGTLTTDGASFVRSAIGYDNHENARIEVGTGGHLTATDTTFSIDNLYLDGGLVLNQGDLSNNIFNVPIYAPVADVPLLTANQSFGAVYLQGALNPNQSLTLAPMGTQTTAGQYYVLPGGLTVAAGQSLTIDGEASVTIGDNQTLTVQGTTTVQDATVVINRTTSYGSGSDGILITSGGTLTADGASFVRSAIGYDNHENARIEVGTGGHLTATDTTFSIDNLYLDGGLVLNQGDLSNNIFNVPIYAPIADQPLLTANQSFGAVYFQGALNPNQSLTLAPMGTQTTAGQYYVLPGGLTVAAGQSLTIDGGASVTIADNQSLTVQGTTTVQDATVVINRTTSYGSGSDGILITSGGTLTADGASFVRSAIGYDNHEDAHIEVGTGGHLSATNSTFSLDNVYLDSGLVLNQGDLSNNIFNATLHTPVADIPLLLTNQSFNGVFLTGGLTAGQSVVLAPMGTQTTAGQYYYVPGGLAVGTGAALTIDGGASVTIADNQALTISGTTTVKDATVVINRTTSYGSGSDGILITSGGTLTADGASFVRSAIGYDNHENAYIQVNNGGTLDLIHSTVSLDNLYFYSGSNDTFTADAFSGTLNVDSGATISITGDDFSNVPAKGVVASGDANAKIQMVGNYWGSTVIATIESKIVDHVTNGNLPTIVFQPFVSGASGTAASPATATFSPTDQTINLSATVSTTAGVAIDEGQETFTILEGSQVIGQTTAPTNVSNGAVTATYTLPGNTPVGQYIIEADYSGHRRWLPPRDRHQTLPDRQSGRDRHYHPQCVGDLRRDEGPDDPLSAQVSSKAGTVDEGIVTFTILSGGNPVGSPVHANVTGDVANATYTLLAGTSGGSYTIQAVYTDPIDFTTSTGTNTLTVAGAATTITASDASATFDATTGEGITLSANVSSTAGTINQGAVTFKILDSSSNVVASTVVNVANGVASSNYLLPAGTGVGTYTIQATYDGTPSFATSLPTNNTLTISGSTTTTAASNDSVSFNSAGETADLTASVTSSGGTVSGGKVTFTILSGAKTIGTATSADVTARRREHHLYTAPRDRDRHVHHPGRLQRVRQASSARPTAVTRSASPSRHPPSLPSIPRPPPARWPVSRSRPPRSRSSFTKRTSSATSRRATIPPSSR